MLEAWHLAVTMSRARWGRGQPFWETRDALASFVLVPYAAGPPWNTTLGLGSDA